MNLYEVNGQVKARGKLLADYTEVIVTNAKAQWLKDMKAEYELAYPKYRDETYEEHNNRIGILDYYDEKLLIPEKGEVKIEYEHTFDSWLLETEIVEPSVEEVRNEYGMVELPYKAEVTKLLREFIAPTVTEDMLDEYLKSRYKELRATEYPKVEDYMDAIVKNDIEAQQAYVNKCLEVKVKYPK